MRQQPRHTHPSHPSHPPQRDRAHGSAQRALRACIKAPASAGFWLALFLPLFACGKTPPVQTQRADAEVGIAARAQLTREELLDPLVCQACHPRHYEEWAGSMHAYAAEDPVFLAMNRRGQRETDGALGDFCVRCHAPMALLEGATTDGLNLAQVPNKLRGVTCYFCHNAVSVGEHFNNGILLANDTTMRAALDGPQASAPHGVEYSAYLDSNRQMSAVLCGSCHDVVTPSGVQLERTYHEYEASLFGKLEDGFETCAGCHMPGRQGQAASTPSSPMRTTHEHLWPGVDVAMSPFPGRAAQRRAIECELSFSARIRRIDHDGLGTFNVLMETSAGHRQPSGAAQDRRLWVEVVAYDAQDQVIYESGKVGDRERVEHEPGEPNYDPQLAIFRDWNYDADGQPTHNFWEVAPSAAHPRGYEALTLPFAIDAAIPHTLGAQYRIARYSEIARLTARLRMRPIGVDVLTDLVASGDLDESILQQVVTFTLHGAAAEWRPNEAELRTLLPDDLTCTGD